MKKFTIALDVDDTIMPYQEILCRLMNEKYGKHISVDQFTEWAFTNFPQEDREKLFGIMSSGEILPLQYPWLSAKNMIHELIKDGHQIMFASAVSDHNMTNRAAQISRYFYGVEDLMLGNRKDLLECDFLLDDNANNILRSHAKHPVLFRKSWNQHVTQEMADMMGFNIVHTHAEFLQLVRNEANKAEKQIVCLVGPSGSGKTTIANVLAGDPFYEIVQSVTTRMPRSDDGPNDYQFVSKKTFSKMISDGELLEWSCYKDQMYGTPKNSVDQIIQQGKNAIMILDINGAEAMKKVYGEKALMAAVFRKEEDLFQAVNARNISDEEKKRRCNGIKEEMINCINRCDIVISNTGTVERAANDIRRAMR